jgi:ABC-type polysaccharide/polyol phosphate export permease
MRASTEGFDLSDRPLPLRQLAADVWGSRQLLAVLARKDFYVKYRRASLGMLWAVGLPLFQAGVMAVVFSNVIEFETGTDYPVFVFSGFLGWTFFSTTLSAASTSIVDGASLSSRIYFPRAVLPLAAVVTNLYGFVINIGVLFLLCLGFGVPLGIDALLLVPATALMTALTVAFALLTSALHVYFRDIRYLVVAAMTAWFYVTPVLYPLDLADGPLRRVIEVNPVTGVVQLFRAATVGADPGWIGTVAITGVWVVVVGAAATALQHRFDRVFSDLL